MTRGDSRFLVTLLLAGALGCATANPPLDSANAGYGMSEDEQRLIQDHDRLESELRARGMVFRDPALDAYLARVAAPLLPAPQKPPAASTRPRAW